jgi:hypothetical protein
MFAVESFEIIRTRYLLKYKCIIETFKELGHSRKTLKKVLGLEKPLGHRFSKPREHPVLAPYPKLIGTWLRQDDGRPRKQG